MNIKNALLGATYPFVRPVGVIFMDAPNIADLESRLVEIQATATGLKAKVDDGDELTDEEMEQIEQEADEGEKLTRKIKALKLLEPKGQGRRTAPEPQNRNEPGERRTVPATARTNPGTGGFKNFGEFAMCVRSAGGDAPDQSAVTRLQNALTTYGNEGTGADGGFIVPPDFRREIAVKVFGEESLITRTDQMITSSNNIVLPKDETTPYGTTGVQAYWEAEAGQKTQSKPVFGQNSVRLNKLIALVPVSDEMVEDAPQIDSYLRRKVPEVFSAKLNTAIISGTGVGQPLGILNSPALISVAKETSQAADTIYFNNIVNMWSRMRASSRQRAVWLTNQSIEPALLKLRFDQASTVPIPAYLPPGGLSSSPFGTLLGRPVIPMEAMSALGDVGDIVFADLTQYLTVTKGQDIKTDVSIHLFFDYDVTAFRFVFRVAGQPWWNSPVTPQASGAATLGHFVALAERA
jgi:HK97 family phage major capsid protein